MASLRINSIALLRYAGLFTWACVGLPLIVDADPQVGRAHYWAWLAAYLAFGLAYWLVSHQINRRTPARCACCCWR